MKTEPVVVTPTYHEGVLCYSCTLKDIPNYNQASYDAFVARESKA